MFGSAQLSTSSVSPWPRHAPALQSTGRRAPLHLLVLSRSVPLPNHRVLQWPVGNVPGSVPLRA